MTCKIAGLLIGSLFVIFGFFLFETGFYGVISFGMIQGVIMAPIGIFSVGMGAVGIYNNLDPTSPFITEISRKELESPKDKEAAL